MILSRRQLNRQRLELAVFANHFYFPRLKRKIKVVTEQHNMWVVSIILRLANF